MIYVIFLIFHDFLMISLKHQEKIMFFQFIVIFCCSIVFVMKNDGTMFCKRFLLFLYVFCFFQFFIVLNRNVMKKQTFNEFTCFVWFYVFKGKLLKIFVFNIFVNFLLVLNIFQRFVWRMNEKQIRQWIFVFCGVCLFFLDPRRKM